MYNENELIKDLKHFNELEFFVKKYNSMHYLLELGQDVFNEREIEKFNECASYLKYAIFKTDLKILRILENYYLKIITWDCLKKKKNLIQVD